MTLIENSLYSLFFQATTYSTQRCGKRGTLSLKNVDSGKKTTFNWAANSFHHPNIKECFKKDDSRSEILPVSQEEKTETDVLLSSNWPCEVYLKKVKKKKLISSREKEEKTLCCCNTSRSTLGADRSSYECIHAIEMRNLKIKTCYSHTYAD